MLTLINYILLNWIPNHNFWSKLISYVANKSCKSLLKIWWSADLETENAVNSYTRSNQNTVYVFHNFDFDSLLKPCKNKVLVNFFFSTQIDPLRNLYIRNNYGFEHLQSFLNENAIFIPMSVTVCCQLNETMDSRFQLWIWNSAPSTPSMTVHFPW